MNGFVIVISRARPINYKHFMKFNMAAVHHLGSVGESCGTNYKDTFMVALPRKNFVMIDLAVFKT